jgi:hypothetical protein
MAQFAKIQGHYLKYKERLRELLLKGFRQSIEPT